MDRHDLLTLLDLESDKAVHIRGMKLIMWGQHLIFECVTDDLKFELHLSDCRELKWQVYTHQVSDLAFPPTPLVNFLVGQGRHRKPCYLLTEHFGLTVLYGKLYAWHEQQEINLVD